MARVPITVMGFRCERCAHEWLARGREGKQPRTCPKCKSAYWDKHKVHPLVGVSETAGAVPAQALSQQPINCSRFASDELPGWLANLVRTGR
jgi:hypothetical protein